MSPTATVRLRPVAAAFAVFGTFAGALAVAATDLERTFKLSDAGLGFLMAGGIVAATALAAFGGALSERWGATRTLARALAIWGVLVAAQAAAPTLWTFAIVFVIGTMAGGLIDVVMNVIAADALAAEPGRLVQFHGLFNAGTVVGAALTGVVVHAGRSWRVVWWIAAALAIVTAVAVARSHVPQPRAEEHPSLWRALGGLRDEGLVVTATIFGASAMVEGGLATFGVLYLRKHLGVGVLAGVGAYVAGQSLATVSRAGGRRVVGALGPRAAVAAGATLAAVGVVSEAVFDVRAVAACGLALATVGISVVWPLLVAEVNNEARHPALAIGGLTACGYLGMVAGPPLVGTLSALFGLRVGLVVLGALAALVALVPAHVRR